MTFKDTPDSQKSAAKTIDDQISKVHAKYSFIKLHQENTFVLTVQMYNNPDIGNLLIGDDGYYAYWPRLRAGYWSEHVLEALAGTLKILNEPWDRQVREYHFNEFHRNRTKPATD